MYIVIGKVAEGKIPASDTSQFISASLTNLSADNSYTYWVVATNSEGERESGHGRFSTLPSIPPVIDSESASHVTPTDAALEAQINPESAERGADYQFQVVANPIEYQSGLVCPSEGFPAGSSLCLGLPQESGALPIGRISAGVQDEGVSLDLAGPWAWWSGGMTLKPDTTYHYRVIAARSLFSIDTISWERPIVYGQDRTFTTPEGAVQPSNSTTPSGDVSNLGSNPPMSQPVISSSTALDPGSHHVIAAKHDGKGRPHRKHKHRR
jgi:hypothetical protein